MLADSGLKLEACSIKLKTVTSLHARTKTDYISKISQVKLKS